MAQCVAQDVFIVAFFHLLHDIVPQVGLYCWGRYAQIQLLSNTATRGLDIGMSGRIGERGMSINAGILLLTVFLLAPHALLVESSNFIDNSYTEFILVAFLWMLSHSYGSDFGGPFVKTQLSLPQPIQLVMGFLSLLVSLYLFRSVRRFAIAHELKSFIRDVAIVSLVLLVVITGPFSYILLAGWTFSSLAIPFPVLEVLGSLVLYFTYRKPVAVADAV